MDQQQLLRMFPDIEYDEMALLLNISNEMNEQQRMNFITIYQGKRKDHTLMLVLALLGFVGFAGIHRMITGDIGLGILYFFTAGLCFVGTIIDLINIKQITNNYNRKMAYDAANLATAVFR